MHLSVVSSRTASHILHSSCAVIYSCWCMISSISFHQASHTNNCGFSHKQLWPAGVDLTGKSFPRCCSQHERHTALMQSGCNCGAAVRNAAKLVLGCCHHLHSALYKYSICRYYVQAASFVPALDRLCNSTDFV